MSETKVALVIGAGESTGGAVARRFAREGFFTCVTRRHGDQLASLVQRIEADGGKARAFGSDARREDDVTALFETIERDIGPIEVVSFNVAATSASQSAKPPPASIQKSGKCAPSPASSPDARRPTSWSPANAAPSCSPAPPPASGAAPVTPPSPAVNTPFAPSPNPWLGNSAPRASMSRMSSSMAP